MNIKELCAIFKDVLNKTTQLIKYAAARWNGCKKAVKTAVFAGFAIVAILTSLGVTGTRIAYNVNYEGKVIATVSSRKHFTAAVNIIASMVEGDVVDAVSEPSFSTAIVLDSVIDSDDAVANAIIENTDKIVNAATLIVNGESVATVEEAALRACLEEHKNSFSVEGAECTHEFVDDIKIKSGYYLAEQVQEISSVNEVIATLSVKTSYRTATDKSVAYKTLTQKTAELVSGYTKVITKGVAGVTRVTEDIVLVNGVEQSRTEVSAEALSTPVNEVVAVGTASAKKQAVASSAGFTFPLPSGVWQVSAYYGDGRGHKGIDLRAPKNTAIMAAAAGTVVKAGWDGDFGYCVTIDHGNGLKTLYAHASKVCVSAGQTVSAGETIALVGSTGNSTGNHLHFEVRSGNSRLNPAPYIGL